MYNYSRRPSFIAINLLFILLLVNVARLTAQDEDMPAAESAPAFYPYLYLNANAQSGIPLGVFKQSGEPSSYGGGGLFLVQLGPRPMFAGLDISMQRFDSERINFEETINGFVEQFEQTTKNNAFLAHVVVRVQPWDNSLFRPYLDGLFGVRNLYTRTTLENLDTEDTQSNTDTRDWSLSYGFAAGLQLGVFNNQAVTIDIRCSYLTGNTARFLVRDPDAQGPFFTPIEAFQEQVAVPIMLIPQIGVTVDLSTVDYY